MENYHDRAGEAAQASTELACMHEELRVLNGGIEHILERMNMFAERVLGPLPPRGEPAGVREERANPVFNPGMTGDMRRYVANMQGTLNSAQAVVNRVTAEVG